MKYTFVVSATAVLLACFIAVSSQDTADNKSSIASVDLPYDCEQVAALRLNPDAYGELTYNEQKWVDIKWHKCYPPKKKPAQTNENEGTDVEVIIVNPVATGDDDKIFYGTITGTQMMEARKTCATVGALGGAAISVGGTVTGNPAASEIGGLVFNYSDVSCSSLAGEFEKGNLLVILGPTQIVGMAVANKLTKDVITNIPIVSGADKQKLKNLAEKALGTPPSIDVNGSNVTVKAAGASVSLEKPRIVIGGTPKLPTTKLPKVPPIKVPDCVKIMGKKVCK